MPFGETWGKKWRFEADTTLKVGFKSRIATSSLLPNADRVIPSASEGSHTSILTPHLSSKTRSQRP